MLTPTIGKGKYGSDLVVDLLQRYEIPYVALNPGSTFRGLHDSLVNYGGNQGEPCALFSRLAEATSRCYDGRRPS